MEVRLPPVPAPLPAINTGTDEPIAMPNNMGSATAPVTEPVTAIACKIPTAADALCKTAAKIAPAMTPKIGLENVVKILRNS